MRPVNILHLFADQFRADCIGALGHPLIRTPNLDRLCREGTAFTNAFTPSPVCVPARACMVFGRYPSETGCFDNGSLPRQRDEESFMEALRLAGYRTHGIGKCHFTPDSLAKRGFESRETSEEIFDAPEEDDYLRWLQAEGFGHLTEIHGVRGEMYYIPQIAQMPASHHPTQWVGDRTIEFLEDPRNRERPFYLFSSFIHPHPPFCPPVPWHKLYRTFEMPLPHLPPGFAELQLFVNRFQNRYKYRDRGMDLNLWRTIRGAYYACVSFIDFQVGRMLDVLERTGQLEQTLILFTADHGELLGDYGSFGKRSMHDASTRIPMLARHPELFPAGKRVARPVSLVDLAPTFLEAAGAPVPAGFSGVSLQAIERGDSDRNGVFSQFAADADAIYLIVTEEWKYCWSVPDQREFLFDRLGDPGETQNLAAGNEPAELPGLRKRLQDFLRQTGELSNLDPASPTGWRPRPERRMPEDPDQGLLIQDPEWADFSLPGYSGKK